MLSHPDPERRQALGTVAMPAEMVALMAASAAPRRSRVRVLEPAAVPFAARSPEIRRHPHREEAGALRFFYNFPPIAAPALSRVVYGQAFILEQAGGPSQGGER